MDTYFAPAKRANRDLLKQQIDVANHSELLNALMKISSGLLIILNEDRQIITLNLTFMNALGISNVEEILGMRLGESLNCIHAFEKPNGCGTTPYCTTCGAAIAMMTAINKNKKSEKICCLTADANGETNDVLLSIRAEPLLIDECRYILIFAQDISKQQLWTNMERVFFHDVSNIIQNLYNNIDKLSMDMPNNNNVEKIQTITERLCKEISVQRNLSNRNDDEFMYKTDEVSMNEIKDELHNIISNHPVSSNKEINEVWPDIDVTINTDKLLLTRVLGNMVLNAFEATKDGGSISLTTRVEPSNIIWEIWNKSHIPENIQKRICQRNFSTKSNIGRGLGTFSMKLFGEKYLNGEVSFKSSKDKGTIFTFRIPC